jgi:dTDP-glucose 4,6-dehydratase/UDP-glucuronate decarboxylase
MFNIILEDTKNLAKEKSCQYFKNKKILLLGFSGIVGQYFVGLFLNLLDTDYSPKFITLVSKNKIPPYLNFIKKIKKINIIQNDITKNKLQTFKNYDCIIFSAGYGQPAKFLKDPIETINLNTTILSNFMRKLKPKGKFLYMSSSEIYNKNLKKNLTENNIGLTNTDDPRASYIEAKRCGEAIVNIYKKNFNVDAKSIRLCLAYGPGSKINDDRVLYQFIKRSIKDKNLKIQDSGLAKRKYIYILDAIKMMLNIMVTGKKTTYNIAGKETVTIKSLAKKITNIFRVKLQVKKGKALTGSPTDISLSIKRYVDEFGKINLTKIDDGLKKTIEWHKLLMKKNENKS